MDETLTAEQAKAKAARWRKAGLAGVIVAVLAAAFSLFSFKQAAHYEKLAEQINHRETVTDKATSKAAPNVAPKKTGMVEQHGPGFLAAISYSRPCQPGMRDITSLNRDLSDDHATDPFADPTACGMLGWERLANMVPDIGANYFWGVAYGATSKSGSWSVALINGTTGSAVVCHTGTFPSLTPSASCASTYAQILPSPSASAGAESNGGGYSRQAITWDFSTTRHAKTGNKVFTANASWTSGVIAMAITDGTYVGSVLPLSAERRPTASGDTITVSYDGNF